MRIPHRGTRRLGLEGRRGLQAHLGGPGRSDVSSTPRIGVPRLYSGTEIPVLYPGEQVTPILDGGSINALVARGITEIQISNWLVGPTPGFVGWYRRVRYRFVERIVDTLAARDVDT